MATAATSLCDYGRLSSIIRALCNREVFVVRAISNILRERCLAHALPDGKLIPIPRLGHPVATRYHVTILAMSGFRNQAYCTFWQLGYSQGIEIRRRMYFYAQRGYLGEPLTRSRSCRIDSGTTESMAVLQGRFRYYGVDSCTAASSAVLRNRFRNRFRYYGMDSDTTESFKI